MVKKMFTLGCYNNSNSYSNSYSYSNSNSNSYSDSNIAIAWRRHYFLEQKKDLDKKNRAKKEILWYSNIINCVASLF